MQKAKHTGNRQRPTRQQREQEIIAVARHFFEDRGFDETTIAEIATAVGVVEGTVLHYFRSKRGLMARVIESFYGEITESMERGVAAVDGVQSKLRYVIRTHLAMLNDSPALCMVILGASRGPHPQPDLLSEVHKFNRRYTNIVVQIVKQGQKDGDINPDVSPSLVRNILFGATEHFLWNSRSGSHQHINMEAADELTSVIFRGIANSDASSRHEVHQLIGKLNKLLK